jgi:hypothetical protein
MITAVELAQEITNQKSFESFRGNPINFTK